MLRQNRYKVEDFISSSDELELNKDEICISERHDIVIALEPRQVDAYEGLKDFLIEISRNIPIFDNLTQDYYETVSDETDFPHDLSVVYFEDRRVTLDYWSQRENNQFDVVFSYEKTGWKLISWNGKNISGA